MKTTGKVIPGTAGEGFAEMEKNTKAAKRSERMNEDLSKLRGKPTPDSPPKSFRR
jgi:hypothetical protein